MIGEKTSISNILIKIVKFNIVFGNIMVAFYFDL